MPAQAIGPAERDGLFHREEIGVGEDDVGRGFVVLAHELDRTRRIALDDGVEHRFVLFALVAVRVDTLHRQLAIAVQLIRELLAEVEQPA